MHDAEHSQKTVDAEYQDLSIEIKLTKDTGGGYTAKVYDGLPEEGNKPIVTEKLSLFAIPSPITKG